jgi:hypothetical protein
MHNFLNFLLPSAAPMEWVPFSILVGLFLFGILAYKLSDIPSPQNHYLFGPEIEESIHTPWAGYVLLLPSVLLVVGLLFTFLGLGVAIQQAGGALQASHQSGPSNQLTEQLRTVLGLIGLKFKASVWGILLHLMAQVMASKVHQKKRVILEAYLKERTLNIENLFEANLFRPLAEMNANSGHSNATLGSLEKLVIASNFTQMTNQSTLEAMRETGNDSLASLQEIGRHTGVLGKATEDLRRGSESIEHSAGALKEATAQASSALLGASEALSLRVESIEKNLNSSVREFSDSTSGAISGLKSAVEGIPRSLTDGLHDFSQATSNTLNEFKGELKNTLDSISATMASSSDGIKEGVAANKDLLQKALGEFQISITEGMKKSESAITNATRQLEQAQSEGMRKIDQALRNMDETVRTIHKYSNEMTEVVDQIRVTNQQLNATLQDQSKAFQQLLNNHATVTEAQIKDLERQIKALTLAAPLGLAK